MAKKKMARTIGGRPLNFHTRVCPLGGYRSPSLFKWIYLIDEHQSEVMIHGHQYELE